jgi:hypothetical protein
MPMMMAKSATMKPRQMQSTATKKPDQTLQLLPLRYVVHPAVLGSPFRQLSGRMRNQKPAHEFPFSKIRQYCRGKN